MSKAPEGSIVGLTYDSPRLVNVGDCLQTPSGRCYVLVSVRRQEKGKHIGRWHLQGLVVGVPPAGAKVHPILWYRRSSRKSKGARK